MTDDRLFGRVELGYRPGGGRLGVSAKLEGAARRGAWNGDVRRSSEVSAGLAVMVEL